MEDMRASYKDAKSKIYFHKSDCDNVCKFVIEDDAFMKIKRFGEHKQKKLRSLLPEYGEKFIFVCYDEIIISKVATLTKYGWIQNEQMNFTKEGRTLKFNKACKKENIDITERDNLSYGDSVYRMFFSLRLEDMILSGTGSARSCYQPTGAYFQGNITYYTSGYAILVGLKSRSGELIARSWIQFSKSLNSLGHTCGYGNETYNTNLLRKKLRNFVQSFMNKGKWISSEMISTRIKGKFIKDGKRTGHSTWSCGGYYNDLYHKTSVCTFAYVKGIAKPSEFCFKHGVNFSLKTGKLTDCGRIC